MATVSTEALINLAIEKYISLDDPYFFFVEESPEREIYQRLFVQLSRHFRIMDVTEPNYDVCLAFYIEGNTGNWSLELSLLGPYAELIRLDAKEGGTGEPPIVRESAATSEVIDIIDLVESHGIILLDQDTLETPIELRLTNAAPGHVYLYHALITDRPLIPWRSKLNNWWPVQDEVYDKYRESNTFTGGDARNDKR